MGRMYDSAVDNVNQACGVSAGEIYQRMVRLWRKKI